MAGFAIGRDEVYTVFWLPSYLSAQDLPIFFALLYSYKKTSFKIRFYGPRILLGPIHLETHGITHPFPVEFLLRAGKQFGVILRSCGRRFRRAFFIKSSVFQAKWVEVIIVTFMYAVAIVDVLMANSNDVNLAKTPCVHFAWLWNLRLVLIDYKQTERRLLVLTIFSHVCT